MHRPTTVAFGVAAALAIGAATAVSQDDPGFGDEQSVQFAQELWQALEQQDYVGENAIRSYAYPGT